MHLFLQALLLAAPVIFAGLVHVSVIKTGALSGLARIPLDGGRKYRGRRILGENKSLRGAVIMPSACIACTLAQALLAAHFEWVRDLSLVDFRQVSPVLWGFLLGVGYVMGELPNSFLKRQLDIPAGAPADGAKGVFFWLLDQVDSLFGILLMLCLVQIPPLPLALTLVGVTLVVHPVIALLMYALKLKSRIG